MEAPAYAGDTPAEDEDDWPFPEPIKAEEAVVLNSMLDGAANALRASPLAEDATLLIRLLMADGSELSSFFADSAVTFPLPFGSLIVAYI